MKRLHFFLFVAALAGILVGCRKPVEVSFGVQSQTIAAEGGTYTVELKSNGDWNIGATAEWLAVSPTSGNGDATLTLVAQPNTLQELRSTEIQATTKDNTAMLTVTQEFVPNTHPEGHYLTITPTEVEMPYTGGSTTIDLECDEGWLADASINWVRLDRTEGNGNEQITLTVMENTSFTSRQTEIKFVSASDSSALFVVNQEGAPDPHYLEVNPRELVFLKEGGTDQFTVETDEDWQVACDCNWVTLSTEGGTGNGTVMVTAEPNDIYVARQARVKVISRNLEKTVFVTQEPGDNPYMATVDPDYIYVDSPYGGVRSITITSNCEWTIEVPSWITLQTTTGSYNATLEFIVGYNNLFTTRTDSILVKRNGELLARTVIEQVGRENILSVDVTELTMPTEGGAQYFNITANQSWVVRPEAEWIQCSTSDGTSEGTGDAEVMVKATEWHGTEMREAVITIWGQYGSTVTIVVRQYP
jgi:hypothetical protein